MSDIDPATQAAINALRTWKANREAKGRPVLSFDIEREALERWGDMEAEELMKAINRVKGCAGD